MSSVPGIAGSLRAMFGEWADEADQQARVIQRRRKFSVASIAQTFVFGFLANPRASDEDLARTAAAIGTSVSTQAVEQRYSQRLVNFLNALFARAVTAAVASHKSVPGILDRFADVQLLDSTVIALPQELAETFPGCGGSHGGNAALKLQVQMSLNNGAFAAVRIEAGKDTDQATPLQQVTPGPGVLRIADLGYFNTEVFARYEQAGAYWLSPLLFPTNVYHAETGEPLSLTSWLKQQGSVVDEQVLLGSKQKVACRLIAWRLPEEVANRRRQKLIDKRRRKGKSAPTKERLARCDWGILVTNIPAGKLSVDEARVLYRARWQIELLFKRWKSQGQVADVSGGAIRGMVRLWSRLIGAVVQHWLLLATAWGDFRVSLVKAWDTIRQLSLSVAMSLSDPPGLERVLESLCRVLSSSSRRNKRKRPSTFELLMNPDLLEYGTKQALTNPLT